MVGDGVIVLINQFYPPDGAPTGAKLHALAKALCERGERVIVLASSRSYNGDKRFRSGIFEGVQVVRLPATGFGRSSFLGKLLDYGSFYVALFFKLLLLWPRPKVAVALTTPPFLGLLPALLFGRRYRSSHEKISGTRVIQWTMDLYPDVMMAHRMMEKNSLSYRLLSALTRIQFARSDIVLALGPRMARSVLAYIDTEQSAQNPSIERQSKVQWIPLWADPDNLPITEEEHRSLRRQYGWTDSAFVLMHAGNVGPGTLISEFLEAASRIGGQGPIWAFFGGGSHWRDLESALQQNPFLPIQLHGYAPSKILHAADVHLVSLADSWTGVGVPSKLQNILAIGKPAIFVGSAECESAIWVRESGGGWAVREGDVDGLIAAIAEAKDPTERSRRGILALEYARQNFDLGQNCSRMVSLVVGTSAGGIPLSPKDMDT